MARTILLADDSVTIQKVVELTFMDEDYEVVAVSNGDEAVTELEGLSPDLVIADVHMPGATGFDVCRKAKDRFPGLPVLLLVGTFEPFEEEDAEAAGADGHLKKPFDSQELLRRVEELLEAGESPAAGEPAEEAAVEVETEPESLEAGEEPPAEMEAEPLEAEPADEETGEAPELEVEPSPWEDVAEEEPIEVEKAEGLVTTETFGAGAEDEELRVEPPPPLESDEAELPVEEEEPEARAEAPPTEPSPGADVAPSGPETEGATPAATGEPGAGLSEADVDRIARRVVELLGDRMLRDIAWEVVPDLAEVVIKDRIRELERQVE